MKQSEMEEMIRRAAPHPAPLGDERANRVLQNALRARRNGGHGRRVWGMATLGAATFATVTAVALLVPAPFVRLSRTNSDVKPVLPANPVARQAAPPVRLAPTNSAAIRAARLLVPPVAVRPHAESVAFVLPRRKHRRASSVALSRRMPETVSPVPVRLALTNSAPLASQTASVSEPKPDGFLSVAATGTGDMARESLTVTVRENVSPDVPGRAEAAASGYVLVSAANADTETNAGTNAPQAVAVPVWTHASIATGQEPVVTVTAL